MEPETKTRGLYPGELDLTRVCSQEGDSDGMMGNGKDGV